MEIATFNAKSKNKIIIAILIGSFVSVLNQTLLTTILPEIMQDFNISSSSAQWITTIFMLVNGIMIPITAFLIGKFPIRKLFFSAILFLIIGTVICMMSSTFSILLLGRSIQALGAGILMPLAQTLLFILFPPNKRGAAMGLFGLIIGFAPAIGPTLSGWLANIFNWRFLFAILLVIITFDFIFGYFFIRNITELTNPSIDFLSIILSTLGFGGLLFGFSIAGEISWINPSVYITIIFSIIILIIFILRQLKVKTPLLQFRVFQYRNFSVSMTLVSLMFMLFIGNLTLLPIYMQNILGWSSLKSGLILLPGGLIMGLLSPLTGKAFDKYGGRLLSMSGMLTIGVGFLLLAQLNLTTSDIYIIIAFSITMMGNSMIMTPMTTQAMNALPPIYVAHGSAMNNTIRQISAAIGTSILVTLMSSLSIPDNSLKGSVFGLDFTFYVAMVISLSATVLSFFLEDSKNKD